jgi:hypothetical protein
MEMLRSVLAVLDKYPEFLRDAFVARSNDFGVDVPLTNGLGLAKYHEMLQEGYGYFFIVNNSKKTLTEKCYFKSFKALSLLPPFEGAKYEVTLQPGEFEIVVIRASYNEKVLSKFHLQSRRKPVLEPPPRANQIRRNRRKAQPSQVQAKT